MAEKYFTAKEIAERLGITDRWVRQMATAEHWLFIESTAKARNGKAEIKYPLSALPLSLQAKIGGAVAVPRADTPLTRMELEPYNRELADARLTTLELFKRFGEGLPLSHGKAVKAFLAEWHCGRIASAELRETIGKLSARTLYRWQTLYKEGGLTALAPNYGKRRGTTSLPEEYRPFVMAAYLNQNERSARSIYNHIIHTLALQKTQGQGDDLKLTAVKKELYGMFGYRAVIRYIQNNATSGLLKKARGVKTQREKVQAYLSRNPETLPANGIWVSDGRDADVMVIDEYKNIGRPVLIIWQDIRSNVITGWDVDMTENTDLIISSLCNGVEDYGLPQMVYTDNGKAYVNKRTSDKYADENRLKAYALLGIELMTARPYNGREKKAERTWGTIAGYVEKYLHGYVGRNAEHKPEEVKALARHGKYIDLEQYKQAVAYGIQMYNTQPHTGLGMEGKAPLTVFNKALDSLRKAPMDTIETLRMIVCPNLRTVQGGGRVRLNNREYIAPELLDLIGDKVQIAVDKNNLNIAHIFMEGKFIARAEGVAVADFFDSPNTHAAFKQLAKQKGKEKKLTKELAEIKKKQSQVLLVDKAAAIEAQGEVLPIEDKKIETKRYLY